MTAVYYQYKREQPDVSQGLDKATTRANNWSCARFKLAAVLKLGPAHPWHPWHGVGCAEGEHRWAPSAEMAPGLSSFDARFVCSKCGAPSWVHA